MSERRLGSPRFKVGQVVRINTDWYRTKRKNERYQRITGVFAWTVTEDTGTGTSHSRQSAKWPWGYRFLNGDEANERFVKALTGREKSDV